MTNEEAYNKLLDERPTIISVLLHYRQRFVQACWLAHYVTAFNDPPELVTLIRQSAEYIYEKDPCPCN